MQDGKAPFSPRWSTRGDRLPDLGRSLSASTTGSPPHGAAPLQAVSTAGPLESDPPQLAPSQRLHRSSPFSAPGLQPGPGHAGLDVLCEAAGQLDSGAAEGPLPPAPRPPARPVISPLDVLPGVLPPLTSPLQPGSQVLATCLATCFSRGHSRKRSMLAGSGERAPLLLPSLGVYTPNPATDTAVKRPRGSHYIRPQPDRWPPPAPVIDPASIIDLTIDVGDSAEETAAEPDDMVAAHQLMQLQSFWFLPPTPPAGPPGPARPPASGAFRPQYPDSRTPLGPLTPDETRLDDGGDEPTVWVDANADADAALSAAASALFGLSGAASAPLSASRSSRPDLASPARRAVQGNGTGRSPSQGRHKRPAAVLAALRSSDYRAGSSGGEVRPQMTWQR